jgi:hypothetical protein
MNMFLAKMAASAALLAGLAAAQSLDFEVYRTKVEPIFLKKRAGHARCIACHEASNNGFRLQQLAQGSTSWTEEQSRKNFESVTKLVNLSNPTASKLLIHPLAPEAGGDIFHSGGRQFTSKDDPDWAVIADWIRQAK